MRLVGRLAGSIQLTLSSVLEERASFLKALYDEVSDGPAGRQRYVDIGAGRLTNTRAFGEGFQEVYALDVKPASWGSQWSNMHFIVGDAQAMPLKPGTVDLVSMLSVIEHLPCPQKSLCEVMSLLAPGAELIIQAPNPRFPVDLHTGLPNPFFIPRFARGIILKALGHGAWIKNVYSHPREEDLSRWLGHVMELKGVRRVVYPAHFVPRGLRAVYRLLAAVRLLDLVPLSYLYVYRVTQ